MRVALLSFVLLANLGCGKTPPKTRADLVISSTGWAIEGGVDNDSLPATGQRFTAGLRLRIDTSERITFFSRGDGLVVDTLRRNGVIKVRARVSDLSCTTNYGPIASQIPTSLVVAIDLKQRICRLYLDGADMTESIEGSWPTEFSDAGETWTIGGSDGFWGVVDDVFVDLDAVWSSSAVWSWHANRSTAPLPMQEVETWCRGGDDGRSRPICEDATGNGRHWRLYGSARWIRGTHVEQTVTAQLPAALMRQDFVFLGQSNGSGRGSLDDLSGDEFPHRERIFIYGNDGLVHSPAAEPWDDPADQVYPISRDSAVGVGPAITFANAMLEKWGSRSVGLLPCTRGGSKVAGGGADSWMVALNQPDRLFGECVARIRGQLRGELAGFVVYQGEAEAANAYDAENIRFRWVAVIKALRDVVERRVPVLFVVPPAEGPPGEAFAHWQTMRTSLLSTCDLLDECRTVEAPLGPWIESAHIHLGTEAQLILGRAIATEMLTTQHALALPD